MNFDEKVVDRIKRLEREVERLQVKESPIMSNYLLTTGKAADSDKLDGLDSTAFVQASALGEWQNWTPTLTGWSSTTLLRARYCQVGKMVFGAIMVVGTSNATTAKATLPITASSTGGVQWRGAWGFAYDNDVMLTSAGAWVVGSGGTAIGFFKTMADGAAWTAANSKGVYATFFYEAA